MEKEKIDNLKGEALAKFLLSRIPVWRAQPEDFVWDCFQQKPDEWQLKALRSFRDNQRTALVAAKGVGKSCCMAWAGLWFLVCFRHSNVFASSVTDANLRTGLIKELNVWAARGPAWLRTLFKFETKAIRAREAPNAWFLATVSWSKNASEEEQASNVAGKHNPCIAWLADETGSFPVSVMTAIEAILTGSGMARIIQSGNCESRRGALYDSTKKRHLWKCIHITSDPEDPMRSTRVSKEYAQGVIDQYGRDHPFALINVLGVFPKSELSGLISEEEVEQAVSRKYAADDIVNHVPKVGIDVSRAGVDETVLVGRRGFKIYPSVKMAGGTGREIMKEALEYSREHFPDIGAEEVEYFIDDTGGHGGSAMDVFNEAMLEVTGVVFNERAKEKTRFANVRAEMWWEMCEGIRKKMVLPDDADFVRELTEELVEIKGTWLKDSKLQLEPKEDLKAKIGRSPDTADALAMTFVTGDSVMDSKGKFPNSKNDESSLGYDPFDESRIF